MSRSTLVSLLLIAGCTSVPAPTPPRPIDVAAIVRDCDLVAGLRHPPQIQRLSPSKSEKPVICGLVDGEIQCEQRDVFVVREIDTNEKIRRVTMSECIRNRLTP